MTAEEFDAEIAVICGFYDLALSDTRMVMWRRLFQPKGKSEFHDAVQRHIETSKYNRFPTPGNISECLTLVRENNAQFAKREMYDAPKETSGGFVNRAEWHAFWLCQKTIARLATDGKSDADGLCRWLAGRMDVGGDLALSLTNANTAMLEREKSI